MAPKIEEIIPQLMRLTPTQRATVQQRESGLFEIYVSDTQDTSSLPYVELKVVPSDRTYGIFHVTKETRGFFPGYKEQFVLETNVKPFVMHLTGGREDTQEGDNAGGYIGHPRPSEISDKFQDVLDATHRVRGSFKRYFDENPDLSAGDFVRIYRADNELYKLE